MNAEKLIQKASIFIIMNILASKQSIYQIRYDYENLIKLKSHFLRLKIVDKFVSISLKG